MNLRVSNRKRKDRGENRGQTGRSLEFRFKDDGTVPLVDKCESLNAAVSRGEWATERPVLEQKTRQQALESQPVVLGAVLSRRFADRAAAIGCSGARATETQTP